MQRRTLFLLGSLLLGGFSGSFSSEILSAEPPAMALGVNAAADPFKPVPPADTERLVEGADFQAEVETLDSAVEPADATAVKDAADKEAASDMAAAADSAATTEVEGPGTESGTDQVQLGTDEESSAEEAKAPEASAEPKISEESEKDGQPEADAQPEASPERETTPALKQPLPPAVKALQPRIRRVLDYHFQQPADAGKYDVWEAMHAFLPYGVDAQMRAPQYRQPVNAIGWICWNGPCRGHRLFELDKQGRLKAKQGPRVQGHHGQFLAMLAQSYVPPEFEIRVDDKAFTVADLIEFEKETCVPKSELTFKLIALSHYLPADATWKSRDGQQWSIERLLQEEITQQVIGAACGGTHRLGGIAFAVKSRKKAGLPMDGVWAKADDYLDAYLKYTFQIQNPDGSFSTNWFDGRGMENDLDRRLQTSGHILEFALFALPKEKLTSPEVVRAVNYVTTILERNPRRDWSIGPKGHALHALAMYDQLVFGTKPGSRSPAIVHTSRD